MHAKKGHCKDIFNRDRGPVLQSGLKDVPEKYLKPHRNIQFNEHAGNRGG